MHIWGEHCVLCFVGGGSERKCAIRCADVKAWPDFSPTESFDIICILWVPFLEAPVRQSGGSSMEMRSVLKFNNWDGDQFTVQWMFGLQNHVGWPEGPTVKLSILAEIS